MDSLISNKLITKLTVLLNKKGAKPTTHQIISTKGSILAISYISDANKEK